MPKPVAEMYNGNLDASMADWENLVMEPKSPLIRMYKILLVEVQLLLHQMFSTFTLKSFNSKRMQTIATSSCVILTNLMRYEKVVETSSRWFSCRNLSGRS